MVSGGGLSIRTLATRLAASRPPKRCISAAAPSDSAGARPGLGMHLWNRRSGVEDASGVKDPTGYRRIGDICGEAPWHKGAHKLARICCMHYCWHPRYEVFASATFLLSPVKDSLRL